MLKNDKIFELDNSKFFKFSPFSSTRNYVCPVLRPPILSCTQIKSDKVCSIGQSYQGEQFIGEPRHFLD